MAHILWTRAESLNAFRRERGLIFSGQRFSQSDLPDVLPNRFPLLLSAKNQIIDPVFAYLYHVSVVAGKSRSSKTLSTYMEHLSNWYTFLEENNLEWTDVDEELVAHYRNRMSVDLSKRTGESLAADTINARLGVVFRFYQWHYFKGHIKEPLLPEINRLKFYPELGHQKHKENPLFLRRYKRFPRLLTRAEIIAITRRCEPVYRLMIKWAAVTGARRSEICGLRLHQIPHSSTLSRSDKQFIDIRLTRKGGHPGVLHVPAILIHETNQYIAIDRQIKRFSSPRHLKRAQVDHVFLTSRGTPVIADNFTRVFRKEARAADVNATPHHLRHTYAACMLQLLQDRANKGAKINPLKTVQVLLGHRRITSTEIYLQVLRVRSQEVENAVAYLYGKTS